MHKYDAHALILYPFLSPHLLMTEGQDRQGIFSYWKNQTGADEQGDAAHS